MAARGSKTGVANERVAMDGPGEPARPARLTVDFTEEPDMLVIRMKGGAGPWAFLLLWLIGWTVGSIVLLGNFLAEPNLWLFMFALPFWASWLFVAGLLVGMLFGKETLILDRDGARFFRTALIRITSREVPRGEIRCFQECRSQHAENDHHLWGIEIVTLGKPVQFAFRLSDQERLWFLHRLNRFLEASNPEDALPVLEAPTAVGRSLAPDDTISKELHLVTETLTPERTLAQPPTDCRWRRAEDRDVLLLWQRGRLSVAAVAGLLFINAFWNGIVSVFVMTLLGIMPVQNQPQGGEWWALFVFLIPFEAIGIVMLAGLVLAVLEPFRCTEWQFECDRIVSRTCWPAFRHKRTWEVPDLGRLELRRHRDNDPGLTRWSTAAITDHAPFALAFVAENNVDVCQIGNLTEGEARWMAGIILEERKAWFGG